jgi:hypothetical protein
MNNRKDTSRPPEKPPEAPKSVQVKGSGRAKFDSRGNAVWEWHTEDGEFSTDVSTQRVKKLEAPELSIEETAKIKKLHGLSLQDEAMPGGGFNPYDRGTVTRTPPNSNRDQGRDFGKIVAPAKPAPEAARKPVKDLKRLQEWMDMKKRLESQKDDD